MQPRQSRRPPVPTITLTLLLILVLLPPQSGRLHLLAGLAPAHQDPPPLLLDLVGARVRTRTGVSESLHRRICAISADRRRIRADRRRIRAVRAPVHYESVRAAHRFRGRARVGVRVVRGRGRVSAVFVC